MNPDAKLERRSVVKMVLENRGCLAVVAGLGSSAYDLMAAGDHDRNLYLWGAMGSAVTIGLGLAVARPELPVAVITGDGEMLMGLGALATVGTHNPANLTIIVLDNGHYGETGMQRSHTSMGVKLSEVALGCGICTAKELVNENDLLAAIPHIVNPIECSFLSVVVTANSPDRVLPTRDGAFNKMRFRASLGIKSEI